MGSMLGIGAAGLVGGAVIGELIEHHEDEERFDAYQDGKLLFLFLYVDVLRRWPSSKIGVDQGRMDDYGGGGGDYGGGGGDYGGDGGDFGGDGGDGGDGGGWWSS